MPAVPDREILTALFGREPADAIRHLEAKGLRITFNWQEMLDEAHARAFTVAKAMRVDILQDIRRALIDAMRQGKTFREFALELEPALRAKGWWGKGVHVDPDTLEARLVQLGSSRRLWTIYQTNLQSAFMAGRYKRQMQADAFPYLMYVAVMDARTRPSHAALNGKVYRKDDPVWDAIYPSNGFNCRCRTRALTEGQLAREGRTVETAQTVSRTVDAGFDPLTGEVYRTTQTGVRYRDPIDGRDKIMWVDAGFNASPLASHLMDELFMRKARAALGDAAARAALAEMLASAPRLRAWRAFVENTLAYKLTQGQTGTLGVLPAGLKAENPVIWLEDRLIAGKKGLRHVGAGDAPSREQWLALPELLKEAVWYRDTRNNHAVALLPDGLAVIVDPVSGRVTSVYRDAAAADKIRRGIWIRMT